MKGKNILYGTGLYLLSLWALYGKKRVTGFTTFRDRLSEAERNQMFGRDEYGFPDTIGFERTPHKMKGLPGKY